MGNLIFAAFSFKKNVQASFQMLRETPQSIFDTYLKNAAVSLVSAKAHNPNDDVALIFNCSLPEKWREFFNENGILLWHVDFNCFVLPDHFCWTQAYYKLCATRHVCENTGYERVLMIDCDTVTVRPFDDLWAESDHGLMLFTVLHTFSHSQAKTIQNAMADIYGTPKRITHYGGEFIAGKMCFVRELMEHCKTVFDDIASGGFKIGKENSDETVLSIAAAKMNGIIAAGAYIFRYTTLPFFYFVSTNYVNDPVCIWHLPAEKKTGIPWVYNYYIKKKQMPSPKKMAKIFGFPSAKMPGSLKILCNNMAKRLKEKLGL